MSAPGGYDQQSPYGSAQPYGAAPLPGGGGVDPYGPPQQWGQQQTGQQQAGYGPTPQGGYGYGSAGMPPSGPPRRSRTGAVIGGIAATVVVMSALIIGLFVWPAWLAPDTSPTDPGPTAQDPTDPAPSDPAPTDPADDPTDDPTTEPATDPTTDSGAPTGTIDANGVFSAPGYTFQTPVGWTVAGDSGESNDGSLASGSSELTVYDFGGDMAYCESDAQVLPIWVGGEPEPLPEREIGGSGATGNELTDDSDTYHQLYCVAVGALVYEVTLQTPVADMAETVPQFEAALDSWQWG